MKTCKKGLHQYDGKECLKCKAITLRAWAQKNKVKQNKYKKAWYAKNPEYIAHCAERYRLRKTDKEIYTRVALGNRARKYGLKPNEPGDMLAAQGFMCANDGCKATNPGNPKGWHIDHCHRTGKVRAILCSPCNVALGHSKESKERLLGLVRYLETYSTIGNELERAI